MISTAQLSMGLRADEAREILVKNNYTQKKYACAGRAGNEVYAITSLIGGLVGPLAAQGLEYSVRCSAKWINDPSSSSCDPQELTMGSVVMGVALGVYIPLCLLDRVDKKSISEAERINRLRNSVMKVIDDNYQGCNFHRPLKDVHISELLRFTDGDTQRQLLDRLNEAQAVQTLRNKSMYSAEVLKSIQDRDKPDKFLDEIEWEVEVKSEVELWTNLELSLKNNGEDEIRETYNHCRKKFGERVVDTFVEKRITNENLKNVETLGDNLSQLCRNYYQNNKKEIDCENFFQ